MQVSNEQINKILLGRHANAAAPSNAATPDRIAEQVADYLSGIDEPDFETPKEMVQLLVAKVIAMPDREDRIAELRSRIEAGDYNPTSEEIADAMIRRSIADSVR